MSTGTLETVVIAGVAGLTAGCLARAMLSVGGLGLIADLLIGVAGSIIGSAIYCALIPPPDGGRTELLGVALVGALSMIVAQRLWDTAA
jgi:uncharacterized membrane protein YeaQ/YmgE (transglycosylase-associated protein family)